MLSLFVHYDLYAYNEFRSKTKLILERLWFNLLTTRLYVTKVSSIQCQATNLVPLKIALSPKRVLRYNKVGR